jgi:integrase/recombinase XerD
VYKSALLGPWVKRFLLEHLIAERNLSTNTQRSYRDTLVLLIPYAATQQKTPVDRLDVFGISSHVLRGFLDHLEQVRKSSIRTRNQRRAAVHALARFIPSAALNTLHGVVRFAPFRSSGLPGMN